MCASRVDRPINRSWPVQGCMFMLVLFERTGADFGHHQLSWLLEVRIDQEGSRRISAFDFHHHPAVPGGLGSPPQPVHCSKRRTIDWENLARDAHASARTVDEPRYVAFAHQVQ